MRSRRTPWLLVAATAAVALAGCDRTDWLSIGSALATDPSATTLQLMYDACASAQPVVSETNTEIHLRFDLKFDYGGEQAACIGSAVVHLKLPIGSRTVIDERHHKTVPLEWIPVAVPFPTFKGSVRELRGQEGGATLTAWLVVDAAGDAIMCDDLPPAATKCPGPTIAIDWASGGAQPPTNLVTRGSARVSNEPMTLHGSLKGDILYVGITP